MNAGPRILTIEDDRPLSSMLTFCLERHGYRVIESFDGEEGLGLALRERPALVVLDLDLPKLNGIAVCNELRRLHFNAPILMLTGRSHVDDRVTGLDAGADDYLGKPFVPRELLARIRALLRRNERDERTATVLELGPVRVDLGKRTAFREGQPLAFTKTEFALLELLASRPGQPVSRETMLDVVWGYTRFPSTRTVDTHMWRLRKKIGDAGEENRWIICIAGQGYQLVQPPPQ